MATVATAMAQTPTGVGGRERILREARALFTAHGYAAVSMQQIADAATVNKATLYHHFRDKEDLFVAVMVEEFGRTVAGVETAVAAGGSLREQLARVAASVFASLQSDFGRLMADLHGHVSVRRQDELRSRGTAPWGPIRVAIESAIERGEVRDVDPDFVARNFFAMVRSQVWWSKYDADHPAPDERLAMMIADLLLDGIAVGQNASSASGHGPGEDSAIHSDA